MNANDEAPQSLSEGPAELRTTKTSLPLNDIIVVHPLRRAVEDAREALRQTPQDWDAMQAAYDSLDAAERALLDAETYPEPWMKTIPPFRDPQDWTCRVALVETDSQRGYGILAQGWTIEDGEIQGLIEVDRRVERQAVLAVEAATADHGLHADASHPMCVPCEMRFRTSPYGGADARHAGRPVAAVAADARQECIERARGYLLRPPMPEPPKEQPRVRERGPLVLTRPELGQQAELQWVITGMVPARSVGILYGPSGSMKSFAALDLAAHIATGRERWHGLDVGTWSPQDEDGSQTELYQPADRPVLYVPGEGRDGIEARLAAWERHHGLEIPAEGLHVARWMPDLSTEEGYEALAAVAEEQRYSLIVVDTLRKAAGGSDENSASERGALIDRLYRLSEVSEGTVLAIAHSGLADGRIRGSSAQLADVDFVVQVEREETVVTLKLDKQKDGSTDVTVTLDAAPAGDSLVLVDHGSLTPMRGIIWTSTRLQDALYGFVRGQVESGIGAPSQSDLVALGKDEHNAGRSTVQRALADLCEQGFLRAEGAEGKAKKYGVGPRPWPSQMGSQ